jgi:pyruvate formate lyase activating enzyme
VSHDCHACVDACTSGALSIPETRLTVSQVVERACADRDRYGSDWEGITLSGGEPLMHAEWCLPLAKALTEAGLDVAVETCGNVYPATVRQVEPFVSTFFYNFMSIGGNRLAQVAGVDLRIVRANLQWLLVRCPQKAMVRIPVIDGFNDDPSELRVTVDWLVGEGVRHLELLAPGLLDVNCSRPASSIPAIPHAAMSSSVLTSLKRHAESLGVDASVSN